MKNISTFHVPFAHLPAEARVLFLIYASAALARYCSQPPGKSTLTAELDAVWNANRLTLDNLSDPHRMTAVLKEHFAALMARGTNKKTDDMCRANRGRAGA